jgi:hypothetical protein
MIDGRNLDTVFATRSCVTGTYYVNKAFRDHSTSTATVYHTVLKSSPKLYGKFMHPRDVIRYYT